MEEIELRGGAANGLKLSIARDLNYLEVPLKRGLGPITASRSRPSEGGNEREIYLRSIKTRAIFIWQP